MEPFKALCETLELASLHLCAQSRALCLGALLPISFVAAEFRSVRDVSAAQFPAALLFGLVLSRRFWRCSASLGVLSPLPLIEVVEMAPRWCAQGSGAALVVAFLVFSPLLCSARSDNREFVEQQGNSSFLCKSSGSCVSCPRSDKEAKKFQCGTSGYHQPFKCLEIKSTENMEQNKADLSGDDAFSEDNSRNLGETPTFQFEGGLKTYPTFKSCSPSDLRMDKFTVLQFEAMVFASFALCSPLVYYRRKHSFSGMTRLPTNPRF